MGESAINLPKQLIADFPMNMEMLGRILQGLGAMDSRPAVETNFEVKNPTEMLRQARRQTVDASTANTQDLAAQMGLKIVGVKSVKYSMSREVAPVSQQVACQGDLLAKASFSMPEIVPVEFSNTANVAVVWVAAA